MTEQPEKYTFHAARAASKAILYYGDCEFLEFDINKRYILYDHTKYPPVPYESDDLKDWSKGRGVKYGRHNQ